MTDWRRTRQSDYRPPERVAYNKDIHSIWKVCCKNNKCTPCSEKSYMGMVEKVRNSINITEGEESPA
jgi:hypothetical protein